MIILGNKLFSFADTEKQYQKANRNILEHGIAAGVDAGLTGYFARNLVKGNNKKLSAIGATLGGLGTAYHSYELGKNIHTSRGIYNQPGFMKKLNQETYREMDQDDKNTLLSYIKSRKDIKTNKGATNIDITKAEKTLGVKFSDDYTWYLQKYGQLGSGKGYLTGISPDSRYCVIANTLAARKKYGNLFPRYAYVVGKSGNNLYYQTPDGNITMLSDKNLPKKTESSLISFIDNKL